MSDTVMYIKPGCPYCQAARDGLSAQGVEFEERDATASAGWRDELMEHSGGRGITPTIVGPDGVQIGWEGKG